MEAKYNRPPSAKTSVSGPTSPFSICSGAMYSKVPRTLPVLVRPGRSRAWATPKSMTCGPSSARMTLDGLRSRWISPAAWIELSASEMPPASATTSENASGPFRTTRSATDGPLMYRVAIHGVAACGSASTTWAVYRPLTRRAASTSRSKRVRNSGSRASHS